MESKTEELYDIETAISYAQLAVHTLKHSANEISPKQISDEIKMLHKKFGTKEVKQLAKVIVKENR